MTIMNDYGIKLLDDIYTYVRITISERLGLPTLDVCFANEVAEIVGHHVHGLVEVKVYKELLREKIQEMKERMTDDKKKKEKKEKDKDKFHEGKYSLYFQPDIKGIISEINRKKQTIVNIVFVGNYFCVVAENH